VRDQIREDDELYITKLHCPFMYEGSQVTNLSAGSQMAVRA